MATLTSVGHLQTEFSERGDCHELVCGGLRCPQLTGAAQGLAFVARVGRQRKGVKGLGSRVESLDGVGPRQ